MKKFSKKKQERLDFLRDKQENLYKARENMVKELGYQYLAVRDAKERIKRVEKEIKENIKKIDKLTGRGKIGECGCASF